MEISRFGFYWLDTWVLANVIQLATQDFCIAYLDHNNDPCGRQFDKWLKSGDSLMAANCLLVLCNRLIQMIGRQIERQLETFKAEGGFTEGLTAERLAYRSQQNMQAGAPVCPLCGKPMIKRVAKKGVNSGKEFWSCSGYPECNGTRRIN
jgi:four helix bundle suffix protein